MIKAPWDSKLRLEDLLQEIEEEFKVKNLFSNDGIDIANQMIEENRKSPYMKPLDSEEMDFFVNNICAPAKNYSMSAVRLYSTFLTHCKPGIGMNFGNKKYNYGILFFNFYENEDIYLLKADSVRGDSYFCSFSENCIELLDDSIKSFSKKGLDIHLVQGVFFGYPLGDVLSFCVRRKEGGLLRGRALRNKHMNFSSFFHAVLPHYWTSSWKEKEGIKKEIFLHELYEVMSNLLVEEIERKLKK